MNGDIKQKYFYRTERWDLITKDMIHIVDSKAPRVVTMDPWPQRIYLAATGQTTVGQFIDGIVRRYPAGNAPGGLEEDIMGELMNMVEQERVIALTDEPVNLPEAILEPMSEEGPVDLLGNWHGSYAYDLSDLTPVDFEIRITQVRGKRFTGTVRDNNEQGGTPGIGTITGTWTEDGVMFTKKMPVAQGYTPDGTPYTDETKPHRPLYYHGEFSRSRKQLTGIWYFKNGWAWKGLIPYRVGYGSGTWVMKKGLEQ